MHRKLSICVNNATTRSWSDVSFDDCYCDALKAPLSSAHKFIYLGILRRILRNKNMPCAGYTSFSIRGLARECGCDLNTGLIRSALKACLDAGLLSKLEIKASGRLVTCFGAIAPPKAAVEATILDKEDLQPRPTLHAL
jgi:hypothetical protein